VHPQVHARPARAAAFILVTARSIVRILISLAKSAILQGVAALNASIRAVPALIKITVWAVWTVISSMAVVSWSVPVAITQTRLILHARLAWVLSITASHASPPHAPFASVLIIFSTGSAFPHARNITMPRISNVYHVLPLAVHAPPLLHVLHASVHIFSMIIRV
jgi:hypothetical protein